MNESDNAVGTYTEAAKTAIRSMLDAIGPEDKDALAKTKVRAWEYDIIEGINHCY